ncbi:MAG: glycosyltransferase family 32 protein [Chitinophagaceae bacterium]
MPVPPIIHQTWKNTDVPAHWKKYVDKVKALHPDWQYMLWTDDDNNAFVKDEFPEFYPVFQAFEKNIMRADVIRYLIMYKIGGLYLDMDYEMLKPFQYADKNLVLPYSRQIALGNKWDLLGNCVFASAPNHIFWKKVIEDLQNNPPPADKYIDVENATGPFFLTRIFFEGKYPDAFLPDRLIFHPPTPRNDIEYIKIIQNRVSEGIHHVTGTWREKTILSRTKNLLKRVIGTGE